MRSLALLALAALAIGLSGCMGIVSPAMGFIYTDVKYPGYVEGTQGAKEGTACAKSYFGVVATGDASAKAAAAAGGIKKITATEYSAKHIVFFGDFCTTVRGS